MKKLFLLFLFLLLAVQAEAATYWSNTSGGAGTCAAASGTSDPATYRTLAQGLACLASGDTLVLKDGTYTTSVESNSIAAGTAGAYTTIRADNSLGAILRPTTGAFIFNWAGNTWSYIELNGIVFDGSGGITNSLVKLQWNGGGVSNQAHHIRFRNSKFTGVGGTGVVPSSGIGQIGIQSGQTSTSGFAAGSEVINSEFTNLYYGMYWEDAGMTVRDSYFHDNARYALHFYSDLPGAVNNNSIYRNRIIHNNANPVATSHSVIINSGSGNVFWSNLVTTGANGGAGIQIGNGSSNTKVYGNTFYGNAGPGIVIDGGSPDIQNNIIYGNSGGAVSGSAGTLTANYCNPTCGAGNYNSATTPFVNAGGGNFQPAGLAVDAAVNLGATYNTDQTGAARSVPWDIGAYEFITGAVTDNFNRANGALGANWQGNYTGVGNGTIVSQKVRSTALGQTVQTWATPVGLAQSAQVTLATFAPGLNGDGAVILRATAPPTDTFYYIGATNSGSTTYIYRCEAGPCSLVHEDFSSFTWAQGDRLKAAIDLGGNISIFRNGALFTTYTDPTPLTGTFSGIGMFTGNAITDVELDDFDNGVLAPTPGTITWTCDRCSVESGSAVGTAPPSLTNWVINNLALAPGVNIIAVTVTDSNGNASSDTLLVNFVPSFPGNTLAGSWGFEAGSGTTAIDSSGNSNDATFVGAATWQAAGRFGNAISFNGIDQSLTVPDPANNSLDFTQSFTLSAWVQPSVIQTDYRTVMAKANTFTGVGPVYSLYASVDSATCHTVGSGAVTGLIRVNGASGPSYVVCGAPLAVGVWTHIAVTYDGFNLKLYRNGVLEATTPVPSVTTPPTASIMEPSTGPLQIGASEFGEQFAGAIDELRAYNYALPITAGSNTVPGAACVRNQTASVVGDMNCSVVASGVILAFKLPASATGLKVGPTGSLKVGSQ